MRLSSTFVRLGFVATSFSVTYLTGLTGLTGLSGPTGALAGERFRVRAESAFGSLSVSRDSDWAEISGALRDDEGQPIPAAEVALSVPEGASAEPCRPGDRVHSFEGKASMTADAHGAFCLRVPVAAATEGATIFYPGDAYHGGAQAPLPASTRQRHLNLEFERPALGVSLDSSSAVVSVTTRVVEPGSSGNPVRLVLTHVPDSDETKVTELAVADVTPGETARFNVETRLLGASGAGKFTVTFAGNGMLSRASATVPVLRRAVVHLSLATPPAASDPSDGIELLAGVSSVVGAVTEGWVEAEDHGKPVGTGAVVRGAARLNATFAAKRSKAATLTLALVYVPATSGLVPGAPLVVEVPILPPSPWRGAPFLATALAVTYLVVRSWRRPERAKRPRAASGVNAASGKASVDLLELDPELAGWRGRVVDAHEGTPIEGARVSIVVPVFDGDGIAAAATSGADGAFAIAHVEAARNDGARLVVSSPFHATLSVPAPRDGLLSVSLVSRRRALLERFARWAANAGYGRGGERREPTPLELADGSRREPGEQAAEWAASLSEAAYGTVPPDEHREQEINRREPPVPGLRDER